MQLFHLPIGVGIGQYAKQWLMFDWPVLMNPECGDATVALELLSPDPLSITSENYVEMLFLANNHRQSHQTKTVSSLCSFCLVLFHPACPY